MLKGMKFSLKIHLIEIDGILFVLQENNFIINIQIIPGIDINGHWDAAWPMGISTHLRHWES